MGAVAMGNPGQERSSNQSADGTGRRLAETCSHCESAQAGASRRCRHRYDHNDHPEIRLIVAWIELFGSCCGDCGRYYRADAPATMRPGTPFGLVISEDAIANAFTG
jgi:transposase